MGERVGSDAFRKKVRFKCPECDWVAQTICLGGTGTTFYNARVS